MISSQMKAEITVSFPTHRLRRLRRTEALRGMVRETRLAPTDFVYPHMAEA